MKNQSFTTSFSGRRKKYALIAALVVLGLLLFTGLLQSRLLNSSFFTGYVFIGCLFFLTALGMRKRLSFIPNVGSASFWMQLHIYVGFATFVIFAMHINWRIPDGGLEIFLSVLYLFVALSGVYGLYATRVLPKRLTAIDEEIIYERIPAFRQKLAVQARAIVLEACEASEVLAKFYSNRLIFFFERPRSLAYRFSPSGNRRRQLVGEIEALDRFLAEDQRVASRKLAGLVRQKDDLDFHHAIQGRLKIWLFAHIGVTYSLLVVAIVHGIMAHAFSGATP
jgi:hypothetical protein